MTLTIPAVKFAPGSDSIVEGLGLPFGGPFGGKDLHGTYFDTDTDFCLDLYPPGARPVMYEHGLDAGVRTTPVGRVMDFEPTDEGQWVKGQLDMRQRYVHRIQELVEQGKLSWSSGVPPHLILVNRDGHIRRWPVAEMTLTPAPANPDALVYPLKSMGLLLDHMRGAGVEGADDVVRALDGIKRAIPVHHTDTAEGSWDAGAAMARTEGAAELRRLTAWQDPEGDPEAKSSYKFPHHNADGSANLTAASAGIGVLNGGRGGADIPDGDRRAVYAHLAAHLSDANREPPELKSVGASPLMVYADHFDRVLDEVEALVARSDDMATQRALFRGIKEGRVISTANWNRLKTLRQRVTEALDDLDGLLSSTEPGTKRADPETLRLLDEYLITQARQLGVPL